MIELRDISKNYPTGGGVLALKNVNLDLDDNEFTSIIGASGSGKSTLLHVIGLIHEATTGSIKIDGVDVASLNDEQRSRLRGRSMGFVFQTFHLINHLTVIENVRVPLGYQGMSPAEQEARAKECLEAVGLSHRMDHLPSQLSGGESQRTAIARALAVKPKIIFADEPTGALDVKTGDQIFDLLKDLNKQGTSVIFITHDNELASKTNRIIRISDGEIIEDKRC